MRVLGIDPGYDRLGVAVLEKQDSREQLLFSTCLTSHPSDDFASRLLTLGTEVEKILTTWRPTQLAIEKLFISKNQKTATNVAEVRGMIMYLARRQGLVVRQFTPAEIKVTITGYGQADKKQVIEMVGRLIALAPGERYDDEYDAIAAALTGLAVHM